MSQCDDPLTCECGGKTGRDFHAEGAGAGSKEYGETFWSQSLAIGPSQTAEHKRLFPDVKVRPDGCIGFDSPRQHDKYLKRTGFTKLSGKNKKKSTAQTK